MSAGIHRHAAVSVALWVLSTCLLGSSGARQAPAGASGRALFEQGQALAGEGRLAQAEVVLDKALTLLPEDKDVLTLLGKVKGKLGESAQAIALFQRAVALEPRSAEAHLNLAIALSDSGDLEKALHEADAAIAIDRKSAAAHLNRARILDDMKREPEAEAEFAVAQKLAPNDPSVYFYWAFAARAAGDFSHETTLLRRAVQLQPANVKALVLLAKSLMEQSKDRDAEAALRRALAIDPDSSDATYLLSRLLIKSNPEESKQLAGQFSALRAQSAALDRSKALGNEAYGATLQQDWPRAIGLYRQALEVCGECDAAEPLHRNLGLTLCRSGNTAEGELELRKALAMDPDDREAVKALSILAPDHGNP